MYKVKIKEGVRLENYLSYTVLLTPFNAFQNEALLLKRHLSRRKIWMVNSTEHGGGVAEMLSRMVSLLRQLELKTEWLVMETSEATFLSFTKKLHNLIHGQGNPMITAEEIACYEHVCQENAKALAQYVHKDDIVVIHDPQPVGMITELRKLVNVTAIWRCHIGADFSNDSTQAAWDLLLPYLKSYDHHVFSSPEYIPEGLSGNVSLIYPSLDPLSHKNRELTIHKLTGILCNAGLLKSSHPTITPAFKHQAKRLQADGTFVRASNEEDIGLLFRPVITQISRWDYLKGFLPLMQSFVYLKKHINMLCKPGSREAHTLLHVRLVLAGPDPAFVSDDPEGKKVLQELLDFYQTLPKSMQEDIVILKLPMESAKENALMVNALQRCSYLVAQNSLREGFGLTATEAMWKRIPVLASNACGLRNQVRDQIDGLLIHNPEDPQEIASKMCILLTDTKRAEAMGFSAERRVLDQFLIFHQISRWLNVLHNVSSP